MLYLLISPCTSLYFPTSPYTSACTRSFHPQPTRIHPPEVARELEDPFIHPPNEAPLVAVQQSFNARLLSGWGFPVLVQPLEY